MLFYLMGLLAFLLYLLYDLNSVLWKRKWMRPFFALGTLLLGLATALGFWSERSKAAFQTAVIARLMLIPALICFLLMLHALFFALPFEETYVKQTEKPKVYDRGQYALCRHPGILWFCLMYLFLALSWQTTRSVLFGAEVSLLNIAYGLFQDRWTFLRTFEDYREYRRHTPFLIPTGKSINRALKTRS